MRLDNNVPNVATCRSLELRMIRCIDEMKEQVRRDVGLSVTDAQVERVLAGKPCSVDDDARGIIQKQGRFYTERLLSAAMEAGFDLKAIPVVMLGGGCSGGQAQRLPPGWSVSGFCPAGRPGKRRRIRVDFSAFVGGRIILREELQAVPSQPVQQPEETIPPEMLSLFNTLMDDE